MKRQNPPQAFLDQARSIEKFLSPAASAAVYTLFASLSFTLIALLFVVLAYDNILPATATDAAVFLVIALLPAAVAILAFAQRPNDLLSAVIRGMVESRKRPIEVAADRYSYKVLLMTGETLCVNLWIYYPERNRTAHVKERLNLAVRAALQQDCTQRSETPSDRELEDTVDSALEALAAEFGIPVLYADVRDVHKIRDAYSRQDDLTPSEYLGTGTLGWGY